MKKSKLKVGMTVEAKAGMYRVLKNVETNTYGFQELFFAKLGENSFMTGGSYNDNLTNKDDTFYDILKIYDKLNDSEILSSKVGQLIWERTENKTYEITLEEISTMLDVPVKNIRIKG